MKRRGQAKKSTVDMVTMCQTTIFEQLPSREEKYKMLKVLQEACEGKMFLELEYSQATMTLCKYMEEDNKAEEATDIIQEIQIETYGSLSVKQKLEFILYQMKLVLMRKDFVRCQILSRKLSKRHMSEKGLEKLKIEFLKFMIRYYIHEKMTLDIAKSYQSIYDVMNAATEEEAPDLGATEQEKKRNFDNFVIYLLICAHDNEKVELLKTVQEKYARELEGAGRLQHFVNKVLSTELLPLDEATITQEMSSYDPFVQTTENSVLHSREFIRQLIQHNIRIIEMYYSRVKIATLANLIGVAEDRAEAELCDMVVNKRISAKINRLEWIVQFIKKKKGTEQNLEGWNKDIKQLLSKVENTCHLINREKMVHQ